MEEMEISDPPRPQSAWGKRISSLSQSLSSLNLPFKWRPTFAWPRIDANFCIVLGRCFAVLLVMAVVYLLFMSGIFTSSMQRMSGQMFDPESVRIHVQNEADERRLMERLREVTMTDHLAGTEGDYVLAQYVEGDDDRSFGGLCGVHYL